MFISISIFESEKGFDTYTKQKTLRELIDDNINVFLYLLL